jgi:hypothetical protein
VVGRVRLARDDKDLADTDLPDAAGRQFLSFAGDPHLERPPASRRPPAGASTLPESFFPAIEPPARCHPVASFSPTSLASITKSFPETSSDSSPAILSSPFPGLVR